jgi:hypothetical protein
LVDLITKVGSRAKLSSDAKPVSPSGGNWLPGTDLTKAQAAETVAGWWAEP